MSFVDAIVFDLDGVLIDSESVWEEERRRFVAEHGGHWLADSQRRLMGMNTAEWSAYLHSDLGVAMPPAQIAADVVRRMEEHYSRQLPLMDGAEHAVRSLAAHWPLAVASSSPKSLIQFAIDRAGLAPAFTMIVSGDDGLRGKPAPDVYLEAARRLGVRPQRCVAVEDSSNGVRAAINARMRTIALPNRHYPPEASVVAQASLVLDSLEQLTPESIESLPE